MRKKIKPITHEEWIKELFPTGSAKPPGSFTIREVVMATGLHERTIRSRVNSMVARGELTFVTGIENSKRVNFYIKNKK